MKVLSAQEFRRKLAGVVDPRKKTEAKYEEEIKQQAINFCSVLPELFSGDFDRKSMWTRIGNGIVSACKKCGGDYEVFVNLALDFVKAEPGLMAANRRLEDWLLSMDVKDDETKKEFIRVIEKKSNVILVYARQLWNEIKGVER